MHLAFLRSSTVDKSEVLAEDFSFLCKKLSTAGVKIDVPAWDDPDVDWTLYSHIILTSQMEYDVQIDKFILWMQRMEKLVKQNGFKMWNSPKTIQWNFNKKYLLELESKGITIPATVLFDHNNLTPNNDMTDLIINGFKKYNREIKEIVIKNAVGAAGRSVWRANLIKKSDGCYALEESALAKLHQLMLSEAGKFGIIIQEFLPQILSEGEWSLIYFNKIFSHAIIKKCPPLKNSVCEENSNNYPEEFRVQRRYGGFVETIPEISVPEFLICFGSRILSLISEDLLHARVDIIVKDNHPYLIELEILDMRLYISEPKYAERYAKSILNL
ncbi:hypothetical protein C0J52_00427 [Blattella germanica]|nr:hypothetical protein C0J52_00427 [Blattella germanica]